MKISILTDANWEAKVEHALRPLQVRGEFEGRDYGAELQALIIVVNCRAPKLGHKQRIRFSRQKAELSVDVMLPLDVMARSSHAQRRSLLGSSLVGELTRVIHKYRFEHFDAAGFLRDFGSSVERELLGSEAARFDHLCAERAPGYAA